MALVSTETNSQYWEPVAQGPLAQCDLSLNANAAPPATLAATTGTFTSGFILSDGFKTIACGVQSSGAGVLTIQRYVDKAGAFPQGAAITAPIVANTALVINSDDDLAFMSFTITVTNTSGSIANITHFVLLLNAA
jgi:hypothetical protein